MKFSEALEVVKEFFLEVLGFLLPGLVAIILFICFWDDENIGNLLIEKSDFLSDYITVILFFTAYILGYIIYGGSIIKDNIIAAVLIPANCIFLKPLNFILEKCSWLNMKERTTIFTTPSSIMESIEKSETFEQAVKILRDKLGDSSNENYGFRRSRSLAMSFIPEEDTKIYTFMFRADLSNQISFIFLTYSIIGLVSWCFNLILFKYSIIFLQIYIILIMFALFLHKTRIRFLRIAYKIAFPLFIAKMTKQDEGAT